MKKIVVGIDVSKKKLDFCLQNDEKIENEFEMPSPHLSNSTSNIYFLKAFR